MDYRLKYITVTLITEKKKREHFQDLGLHKEFLDLTPKPKPIKGKVDQSDPIKKRPPEGRLKTSYILGRKYVQTSCLTKYLYLNYLLSTLRVNSEVKTNQRLSRN